MDARLEALTSRNGGYFRRADALDSGWNDRELAEARKLGLVRRLGQGIYSPAEIYDACDAEARHVILAKAVLARQRGAVALTGVSAAALHGLSLYGHDLSSVHLVRLDGGSSRREAGVRHRVVTDDVVEHLETKSGIQVTSVARTLWETAGRSTLEAGVATADSALRLYPSIADAVRQLQPIFGSWPGSRLARIAISMANGRAESVGESISRVAFYRHGLPMPELQHAVITCDGHTVGTADFYWEGDHHLGEFDGKVKYGRFLRPGESAGDAVFREKVREDAMRSELLGMTRWIWADALPGQTAQLMRRINEDRARSRRLYAHNRTVIA